MPLLSRSCSLSLVMLCSLLGAGTAAAAAAVPEPFLFANLVTSHRAGSSNPEAVASCGDVVVFAANDDHYGRELWRTDGTARGTFLLADLCLGRCSSQVWRLGVTPPGEPQFLDVRIDDERRQLWRTDCTEAGTIRLGDAAGGFVGATWLAERRRLVYRGTDAAGGSEPWVSDGTVAGTRRLFDAVPGPAGSWPEQFRTVGGVAWFVASDLHHGGELWRSDGTPAGTVRVTDLDPGPGNGVYRLLGAAAGRLIFEGIDPVAGLEPWSVAPGSAPRRLGELSPGPAGAPSTSWGGDGNRLLLQRPREGVPGTVATWSTDGTPAGTVQIAESPSPYPLYWAAAAGSRTVFFHRDDAHGLELWSTDGTATGTGMVVDLCPGPCSGTDSGALFPFAGALYFSGRQAGLDSELWRTDGTPAGTVRVADLCPGACGSSPIGPDRGGLVLTGDGSGQETLWHTDGTAAGTVEIGDFDAVWPTGSFFAGYGRAVPGTLLAADDGVVGREPWWTDGTAAGTVRLADLFEGVEDGSRPRHLTRFGDRFVFVADDAAGRRGLWVSDGTVAGTRPLPALPGIGSLEGHGVLFEPGAGGVFVLIDVLDPHGNRTGGATLYWTDGDSLPRPLSQVQVAHGVEAALVEGDEDGVFVLADGLWYSDGSVAGTRRLRELAWPNPSEGLLLDGRFYFVSPLPGAFDDFELAVSDGTVAGTATFVRDPRWDVSGRPRDLVADGEGGFHFVVARGDDRGLLWHSDGTPEGTGVAVHFPESLQPRELWRMGATLFFSSPGEAGWGLWATDGSSAGTVDLQAPFVIPTGEPERRDVAVFDGELVYFLSHLVGPRFWRSDGTVGGTMPVPDLAPAEGPDLASSLFATSLWVRAGRLFIAIRHLGEPWKLWMRESLDGQSVLLGSFPASEYGPTDLVELGSRVYFSVEHEEEGHELWAVDFAAPPPPEEVEGCVADAETLCLAGGRFRLRAEWRDPRTGNRGVAGALPFAGSQRTGLFWFFNENNVELIVKMLDGTGVNGFHWTFYGALTDVEFWIDVEDLETGATRTYHNPPLQNCGRADTATFDARPPSGTAGAAHAAATAAAGCGGTPGSLCLLDRFHVEVDWRNQRTGVSGQATAVPGTDRSGYFWFFRDDNVELVVKVLDGRPVNGHFWVFYGALTDVEYTIRVTDTHTADEAVYHNPPGQVCGDADTTAF